MTHTHYIPESVVLDIKQRADILEVVSDHLPLKKKGANYWACCPFHNENTPSFSVAPNKNLYKCFGCGKSGDSISFLMELQSVSYAEALHSLAERFGIEIPKEQRTESETETEKIYSVLKSASAFFATNLEKEITAKSYLRYRDLTETTIKAFALGYALDDWEALKAFLKNDELAEKSGLLSEKNGKRFDRFRNRIIFPIQDIAGRVVGFGARAMNDADQPKYLNSPESEVYHKSELLYGLFQAKNEIRKKDYCILTEGYLDVISLHQLGIKNTVASSGTSLTIQQVKLIRRFTENVTIFYDGDTAGQTATLKAIDLFLAENMNVKIVKLPSDKDPDSFFKLQSLEFAENFLKDTALDFVDYKASLLASDDIAEKNKVIKDIIKSKELITDEVLKGLFSKKIAEKFALKLVKNEDSQEVPKAKPESKKIALEQNILGKNIKELEKQAVQILIQYGFLPVGTCLVYQYFIVELSDINYLTADFREFLFLFRKLHLEEALETEVLQSLCPTAFKTYFVNSQTDFGGIEFLFKFVLRIKFIFLQISLKENFEKMKTNPEKAEECFFVQIALQNQIKNIAEKLGIVLNNPLFF